MNMNMTITITDGWAVIHDIDTHQVAIAKPVIEKDTMTFSVMGWSDDLYGTESLVTSFMQSGISIDDAFSPEGRRKIMEASAEVEQDERDEQAAERAIEAGQ